MADNRNKQGQQGYQNDDSTISDFSDDSLMTTLNDSEETSTGSKGNQGFASMPKEKQREIASKGGKAAHAQGTAHEWNSSEAAAAGRRGGQKRAA